MNICPLKTAYESGHLDGASYYGILARRENLNNAIKKIEEQSGIKSYPPIVIVPEAIIEPDGTVIHAKVTIKKEGEHVFFIFTPFSI